MQEKEHSTAETEPVQKHWLDIVQAKACTIQKFNLLPPDE